MHASLAEFCTANSSYERRCQALLEARQKIKEQSFPADKDQQDITLNDMVCWCVIRALEKFPEANSHFLDDRIKTFNKVHLGLAVDTPED